MVTVKNTTGKHCVTEVFLLFAVQLINSQLPSNKEIAGRDIKDERLFVQVAFVPFLPAPFRYTRF